MAYIKKKEIGQVAKTVIIEQGFVSLSVTKIMKAAHTRRQTFYDYFLDKYDLLAWVFEDEISEVIADNLNYEHWSHIIELICEYFDRNRLFYQQVVLDRGQNNLKEIMEQQFEELIRSIICEIETNEKITFEPEVIDFTVEIIANSLISEIQHWVTKTDPRPLSEESMFIKTYVEDIINGTLLRLKGAKHQNYHHY